MMYNLYIFSVQRKTPKKPKRLVFKNPYLLGNSLSFFEFCQFDGSLSEVDPMPRSTGNSTWWKCFFPEKKKSQVIHLTFPNTNISWVWYHRLNQYWISFHLGCLRLFVLWRILRSDERDQLVTSVISWHFPRWYREIPWNGGVKADISFDGGFGWVLVASKMVVQLSTLASWESHPRSPHLKDSPFPGTCLVSHAKIATENDLIPQNGIYHIFLTKKSLKIQITSSPA